MQPSSSTLPALQLQHLDNSKPVLFPLGQTVCTRNIAAWANGNLPEVLLDGNAWLRILLAAHNTGCWEEMENRDQQANRKALEPGDEGRIVSAYTLLGEKICVITEWDRSATTVMLAEDY